MDEAQARERLKQFKASRTGEDGKTNPAWLGELELREVDGEWLAVRPTLLPEHARVTADGVILVAGVMSQWPVVLGRAETRELILGSAWYGHYQAFARGLAIWENTEIAQKTIDVSFPVGLWDSYEKRARGCEALVAFFDLRGFTTWSNDVARRPGAQETAPEEIQRVVETLEQAFQGAFAMPQQGWSHIFAKGLGDGLMVVSEARWGGPADKPVQPEHALKFCTACAQTVRDASAALAERKLAVGCGITTGPLTQLYLLGRYDYIGNAANDASKIQAIAYNELCVSEAVVDLLGAKFKHTLLSGKGWRVALNELLGV
jgi:class 3 adenylate cyclase